MLTERYCNTTPVGSCILAGKPSKSDCFPFLLPSGSVTVLKKKSIKAEIKSDENNRSNSTCFRCVLTVKRKFCPYPSLHMHCFTVSSHEQGSQKTKLESNEIFEKIFRGQHYRDLCKFFSGLLLLHYEVAKQS